MPRGQQQQVDGDARFMGIAPRLDPASLPEGMASEARNMRFRHGVAETRKGMYKCPWINNLTPEIDSKVRPFGEVHGVGVFRNPDNLEFVVIAADNTVYYTRQNNNPIELALPGSPPDTQLDGSITDADTTITVNGTVGFPGIGTIQISDELISYTGTTSTTFTGCVRGGSAVAHADNVRVSLAGGAVIITGTVNFTQAFNKIIMWRGEDFAPLVMSSEDDGFVDFIDQWDSTKAYAVEDEVAFGPLVSVTTATIIADVNGSTVYTVLITTSADHGYVTGADVTIAGANEAGYNGRHNITVTAANKFNFTPAATGMDVGTATGTITVTNNQDYYKCTVITTAGQSPVTTAASWSEISTVMPNATHGIFIANRLTAPTKYDSSSMAYGNKRQFVAVSDALDFAHTYFNQVFRINFGSDSEIQDLVVYDENRLLIFTDKDVSMVTGYIVEGTNATFGSSVAIQPVVHNYGVSGRGAAVVVGSDCYFYASRRGIVSLAQTEQSKVRGVDIPLSEPIQPLIDRIDPRHEDKIRLAWWDNKLYCAVPLDDGADGNNALLVYDFINQGWASHDSGTAITPAEFFTATYNNARRLFYVGTDGFLNLIEENDAGDDLADLTQDDGLATTSFESYLLTRGYHTNDIDHREFSAAAVNISTWNPNFTIKAKTDGANESQTLVADRTKSRTAYYRPFDAAPYQEHNNNGDHANPYRADYSVELDVDADTIMTEADDVIIAEAGNGMIYEGAVGGFVLGDDGVNFNRFQETLEPFALTPRTGRYTQLELSNTSGRIKINQATLTNAQGDRTIGVKS